MIKDGLMRYVQLFTAFFKIGLFTFGGGMSMLPMLQRELVESKQWLTEEEILNYFAIGQCTPGIIAVNVATFCGYKRAGLSGAIVSTIGIVCPSWIVITLIAGSISRFSDIVWIQRAMKGVYVAVAALLARAVFTFGKKIITDFVTAGIAVGAFLAMSVWNISGILIVLAAGIIGFCAQIIRNGKRASGRRKEDKE
ncbi:MAG: chromate transporter [Treponema sp.]|jgi:chromate transport protein|uniref:chromate transporter n=1 Tax=unclassified Treponema TaxID=2638727 RepID=UPI0020A4B976|nr:chromate transporter [Treponema sp. OMZ 803]UTC54148.1 chromate transporter [Treponema sp. OMZ 803]